MGRVFIEKAMHHTGINRTNLVGVLTHLIRSGQAKDQGDAIKRLESGEFDKHDLEEQMIRSYQTELPLTYKDVDEDDGYHD